MQEELTMEKKGNRPLYPVAKSTNNDNKKTQDVPNIKLYSRGGRRRESAGSTFPPKSEASRKPVPQRNKTIDKRPRPRGSYYTGAVEGNEGSRLVKEDVELGSVFMQSSRKQSLNHLLNFHFEPRDTHWRSSAGIPFHGKSGSRFISSYKHKYNKEQFLQANCQFIVKAEGDYRLYMNNPDALVDWDLIEQVNINVLEYPSCPICLYPPVAAKMTRCGHIYCWSCMLHYLALSDKTWRKCPICYESVHKKDLKSVVAIPHTHFNTSEEITFKLMKKLRGSLKVCPVDEVCSEDILPKMSEDSSARLYSKFLLAGKLEVMDVIARERNELQLQLVEDENCPEKCFIEQALELLTERENMIFYGSASSALDATKVKIVEKRDNEEAKSITKEHNLTSLIEEDPEIETNISVEDLDICSPTAGGSQKLSKYFYFYQASDGQHIYLHALNIRMLEHTYGSLENCPKILIGKIVEKESGSMTEELRKRLRYLQHLPITCPFEVAEIELKPPDVALPTIVAFRDQIEMRRKRRRRREKEEKRRERRIAEEENRRMGRYNSPNIHIESHHQFPEFGTEAAELPEVEGEREPSPCSERSLSPVSMMSSNASTTPISGSLNKETEYSGLSFAKMLSSSKPRTSSFSETKPPEKMATSVLPTKVINVTGSKVKSSFSAKKANQSDSEPEPEEYVPVPAFNRSFGDAIAMALEKAALTNDSDNNGGSQQGGKKKKKNKQKVLFATSMTFSGN